MESLADYLQRLGDLPDQPSEFMSVPAADAVERALSLDGKEFARAILNSKEFKDYIVSLLKIGEIPGGVIIRLMDYAWGKPAERVEHTGKDGSPVIETVKIIREVVDPARQRDSNDSDDVVH